MNLGSEPDVTVIPHSERQLALYRSKKDVLGEAVILCAAYNDYRGGQEAEVVCGVPDTYSADGI